VYVSLPRSFYRLSVNPAMIFLSSATIAPMRFLWLTAVLSAGVGVLAAHSANVWLDTRIALIGDAVGLQHSTNPGIAWGVRLPPVVQPILILVALIFLSWFAWRNAQTRIAQVAFGLVLGGGAANVIDRLPDGLVTDFFQVGSFPIFNLADSCITIGVGLLLLELLIERWRGRAE